MRIVLGVGLNVAGMRGIDKYMANLIDWLAELDSRNRYVVFSYFFKGNAAKRARLPNPGKPNFELLVPRWPERLVDGLERRGWPVVERCLLASSPPDIYHALNGTLPRLSGAKTISTYYDLWAEQKFRARPGWKPGAYLMPEYRQAALRSDCLVAVSESTKRDVIEIYGADPSKIEVIPTGVNPKKLFHVTDPVRLAEVRGRYGLPERYIVLLGTFEDRRNLESVIEAMAELGLGAGGCSLALVGQPGPYRDGLVALARGLGLEKRVVLCGYVPEADLAVVFSAAQALVHPTRAEGFGTVSLEAMACGCPVITSNIPPVMEAVGDAAITVAPDDRAALVRGLRELLSRSELRAQARAKGLARAALYSYEKIAGRVLSVYGRLAGSA